MQAREQSRTHTKAPAPPAWSSTAHTEHPQHPPSTHHAEPAGDVVHQPVDRLEEGVEHHVAVGEGVVEQGAEAEAPVVPELPRLPQQPQAPPPAQPQALEEQAHHRCQQPLPAPHPRHAVPARRGWVWAGCPSPAGLGEGAEQQQGELSPSSAWPGCEAASLGWFQAQSGGRRSPSPTCLTSVAPWSHLIFPRGEGAGERHGEADSGETGDGAGTRGAGPVPQQGSSRDAGRAG